MYITPIQYKIRVEASAERIRQVYSHRNSEIPVIMESFFRKDGGVWLSDDDCTQLLPVLRKKGTIPASFVAPEFALNNGRYEMVARDGNKVADQIYRCIKKYLD